MRWLMRPFRRHKLDAQLDSELRFHIDERTAELIASGVDAVEARRQAMIEFGGLDRAKEECREARGAYFAESLLRDIRYALRMLRKAPGFAAVAILTLALGIGANTAIFSVVNGVLLNPLPYPHPDRLVAVSQRLRQFPSFAISYPDFLDWEKMNRSFDALAAYRPSNMNLTGWGEAERVKVTEVSASFFPLLGVQPVIGRNFSSAEDRRGAAPVAILSGGFWQRKFGGSRNILGKTLNLGSSAYTIVGVIPESFYFCCESANFVLGDIYTPLGQFDSPWMRDRGAHPGIFAIGRLREGVSIQRARADMDAISRNLEALYPATDKGEGVTLTSLKQRMVSGQVETVLLVLLAAVGFVLLLACANVANLLLVRAAGRAREMAIRSALGASRRQVIRQLLTESVLLALAGGGLGLLLADWGTRTALAALPEALPRSNEVGLDLHVLGFTLFVSLLVGMLFGLAPAWQSSRPDLQETLKEGGRGSTWAHHRTQQAFVVLGLATAMVVLAGAGLMIRSLAGLWQVDPGFDPRHVLTFEVSLPPSTAKEAPGQVRASLRQLTETISAVPGVATVAITDGAFPLAGDNEVGFWAEGQPKPASDSEMPNAVNYIVGDDYFWAMGIPLLRGRLFAPQDDLHSRWVAIVDADFARLYFPNQDAVGKRLQLSGLDRPLEIIGVVGHVKQWGLDDSDLAPITAELYTPVSQVPDQFIGLLAAAQGYVVRTGSSGTASVAAIRSAIQGMNGEQVAYGFESMESIIAGSIGSRRFTTILLAVFAALALLLASIGIYGVIAYSVGRRTHEIGIRIALGAQRNDVLKMVLLEGLLLVGVGIALGLCGGLALTRYLSSLLFGVKPRDPLTFVAGSLVLAGVALLASYIPASRAARIDPVVALRQE